MPRQFCDLSGERRHADVEHDLDVRRRSRINLFYKGKGALRGSLAGYRPDTAEVENSDDESSDGG